MDLRPYMEAELRPTTSRTGTQAQFRSLQLRDGAQYGLPKYHGALALYYNKDLFDQYKAPYPEASWTHSDYQAAVQQFVQPRSAGSAGEPRSGAACSTSAGIAFRCTSTVGAAISSTRKTPRRA